jgi:dolichyl-phosphate beta-glucosyltransferase
MKDKPFISYILPTYQAESFINNNLKQFTQYCVQSDYSSEIIVVNDGSSDRTNDEIEGFLKDKKGNPEVKYINLPVNRGKGLAIKRGVELADGEYIVFTDCDLQYSFENIKSVVKDLVNNKSNIVIASRMHKDSIYKIRSRNIRWIYIRHTAGRIFNLLINILTGLNIEDTQAGLKGLDRTTAELVFKKMTIPGFSFDIDILVCAKENKKKITTLPIEFNYDSEMTTMNFIRQSFRMTFDLFRIFLKKITGYYRR